MAVSGVSNDRNYMNLLGTAETGQTENLAHKYGIEYTTEEAGNLGFEDYLRLMITQLTNQDFMNPTDDNEYMTQMTQYSTLQAMQELAKYSQNNYAMSMIGQTVTASKYSNGKMLTETGTVEQIIRKDDEYQIMINGQSFTFKQIMSVGQNENTQAPADVNKDNTTDSEKDATTENKTVNDVNTQKDAQSNKKLEDITDENEKRLQEASQKAMG